MLVNDPLVSLHKQLEINNSRCLIVVVDDTGAVLVHLGQVVLGNELFFLRLSSRVEIGTLCLGADAHCVAAVTSKAIACAVILLELLAMELLHVVVNYCTYGHAVVPEGHVILAPLEADVHLIGGGNDLVEVSNDVVVLRLGNSHDLGNKARVEEERLPSGDRVGSDERVFGDDWIPANRSAHRPGTVGLHLG